MATIARHVHQSSALRSAQTSPATPIAMAREGGNPALAIVLVVVTFVVAFLLTNVVLYRRALKEYPPKPAKKMSQRRRKNELRKSGLRPAGG
jgi:putative effector of murein hydrolase